MKEEEMATALFPRLVAHCNENKRFSDATKKGKRISRLKNFLFLFPTSSVTTKEWKEFAVNIYFENMRYSVIL